MTRCDRDWESWRILTPVVADELIRFSGQSLVAPQTVLEESYWDELMGGLSRRGHDVFHVLVEADEVVMRSRIQADEVAVEGRRDHLPRFARARGWMAGRADLIVDTTDLVPAQAADRIWDANCDGAPHRPEVVICGGEGEDVARVVRELAGLRCA